MKDKELPMHTPPISIQTPTMHAFGGESMVESMRDGSPDPQPWVVPNAIHQSTNGSFAEHTAGGVSLDSGTFAKLETSISLAIVGLKGASISRRSSL